MLFVGNFSYADMLDEADNCCLMPAVVEAPDAETALERLRALLARVHDEGGLLDGAGELYLDSFYEVGAPPEEGALVNWQKVVAGEDGLYSVVADLPGSALADGSDTDGQVECDEEAPGFDLSTWVAEPLSPNADGDDEPSPEELADAISEALQMLLASDDLAALDEDDLSAEVEPFISFAG